MPRTLYAFLGGVAASGAKYKIEIVATATGFRAEAFSAGGSTAWTAPTLVAEGPDAGPVIKQASAKFADKTKVGRDRTYTRPMHGGPDAGPFPKGGTTLPDHQLCWSVGRSLDLLPSELRDQAILEEGQDADAPAGPLPPVPPVTLGQRPSIGQVVMLCETIPTPEALDILIGSSLWLMTEKMEGDRNQLHHLPDGSVCLTSRGGAVVNCPAHIVQAMISLPPGTSLDGELITVDQRGRAQLYVGAQATVQLFVAFDLLADAARPAVRELPQAQRFERLAALLPPFVAPILADGPPMRMVPWAHTEAGKRMLLAEIRERQGEGVVMRNILAPYEGRRSTNWQRFCDRERYMDGIVLAYKAGTGTLAGLVGGVEVGLYDAGILHSVGWVGSGWTRAQRAEFQQRWDDGIHGYVITFKTYGLTFADQVTRPSGVRIRAATDKHPTDCTFASELGRPRGAMGQPA